MKKTLLSGSILKIVARPPAFLHLTDSETTAGFYNLANPDFS